MSVGPVTFESVVEFVLASPKITLYVVGAFPDTESVAVIVVAVAERPETVGAGGTVDGKLTGVEYDPTPFEFDDATVR
jgi:hypothetical protein